MHERRYRSIAKAVSWRVTGTCDTMLISFVITRKLDWAISIGLVEVVTKMVLYYFHERLWDKVKFGRRPPEYQI